MPASASSLSSNLKPPSRPGRADSAGRLTPAGHWQPDTAWKSQKELVRSELKSPTISTLFQRSSGGVDKLRFQGPFRRPLKFEGYSNNKRSNGSNTHLLKFAILISRASRSEVRRLRQTKSPTKSPTKSLRLAGPAEFSSKKCPLTKIWFGTEFLHRRQYTTPPHQA